MHGSVTTPRVPGLAVGWHAARREWTNFSFRRHRRFDGYLVTMHQSGTHWLKYLLTLMLSREHGLRLPTSISENTIIGGPRYTPPFELSPRLGHSHTIPGPLLGLLMHVPALGFPRYLVLVRDMRDTLLAHFRKWESRYRCSFGEYLRADVTGRRFEKDLWWDLRFMNAWGAIAARHPERVKVLHYERLHAEPAAQLAAVVDFLELGLADPAASIRAALAGATKEAMAARDPSPYGMPVVYTEQRSWDDWYTAADRAWLAAVCRAHLRHDFGYGYADWA